MSARDRLAEVLGMIGLFDRLQHSRSRKKIYPEPRDAWRCLRSSGTSRSATVSYQIRVCGRRKTT